MPWKEIMSTIFSTHSSLGHPNMRDGVWFLWDVKEPTPLFEKSRGRRPRCCGQPSHIIHIMGWVGTVRSQMDWERPVVPLYADVWAYWSHVKMYWKRAYLLSSHPRLFISFHGSIRTVLELGDLFTPLGTPWEDCGKEIINTYIKTATVCFLSREVWITQFH